MLGRVWVKIQMTYLCGMMKLMAEATTPAPAIMATLERPLLHQVIGGEHHTLLLQPLPYGRLINTNRLTFQVTLK